MGSTYTPNLGLRKPSYKDPETKEYWGSSHSGPTGPGVLNSNFDIIDTAVGPRTYTEENYILNDEPLSESLDKLDVKLQEVASSGGGVGLTGPQGDTGPYFTWVDGWDSGTDYVVNDCVERNGSGYVAILASGPGGVGAKDPETESSYWDLFVEKGETGLTGPQGETGPSGGDGTSLIEVVLFPEYPGATLSQAPGGLNTGQFTTDSEMQGDTRFNFYEWLSDETVLNNYDILVQWKVPSTFVQWTEVENKALVIDIKTDTDSTAENNIEIELQKDGVDSYSSIGPFTSTVSSEWNSNRFDNEVVFFDQTDAVLASISAGDVLNIRITLESKDGNKARVGPITLRYIE